MQRAAVAQLKISLGQHRSSIRAVTRLVDKEPVPQRRRRCRGHGREPPVPAMRRSVGPVRVAGWRLPFGAGQQVVVMVARQSLSRLWVAHSSFHSAWQDCSPVA